MWLSRFSSQPPGGCEQSRGGDVGWRKLTAETLLVVVSVVSAAASPGNGFKYSKSSLDFDFQVFIDGKMLVVLFSPNWVNLTHRISEIETLN